MYFHRSVVGVWVLKDGMQIPARFFLQQRLLHHLAEAWHQPHQAYE
jgi:hypothetical protein